MTNRTAVRQGGGPKYCSVGSLRRRLVSRPILVFLLASVGQFVKPVSKSPQTTYGLKCSCRRGHLPILPRPGAQFGHRHFAKWSPPAPAWGVGELIPFAQRSSSPFGCRYHWLPHTGRQRGQAPRGWTQC